MLAQLDRPNVLPMRDQIYQKLKELVRADRCQVGEKLPTSRALAEHFEVSLATAQAALRLLEKDGLVSCEVGRGTYVRRTLPASRADEMRRPTIPTIAVLTVAHETFDLLHPQTDWTAGILYGIQQGLAEDHYALHMIPFFHPDKPLTHNLPRLRKIAPALAGLVTFPFPGLDRFFASLDALDLPWITINQFNHLCTSNFVTADYYGGSVEVGRLFGALGLKRVVFLTQDVSSYSGVQKENGLRDGLSACHVPLNEVEVCFADGYLVEHGYHALLRHLRQSKQPPQAIYTTGDLLALGAIKACQERGLRVPEDVAVVGSTGIEAGEHSSPTLSTVQLPMIEMGVEAARMLLALIRRKEKHVAGKIIPARLVQRGSTPTLPLRSQPTEGNKP